MRPMVLIKSGNRMRGTNSPPIRGPECEHITIQFERLYTCYPLLNAIHTILTK
jgi:hypothetical protein